MLHASWTPYSLVFRETAITSRSRMNTKDTYFIKVWDDDAPETVGWGECPLFKGLSAEDTPEYENILSDVCRNVDDYAKHGLPPVSSIKFGFEMALADLRNGGKQLFFDTPWARGEKTITINGLIWMGDRKRMSERIREKLTSGFRCVKLKIGGIDFEQEVELLCQIRRDFSSDEIEIRLDANGSFTPENALKRLETLADFDIHSIEQPVRAGQPEVMAHVVRESPIPIALDEELIGVTDDDMKKELLSFIYPAYIILKPSLCGGFSEADRWISAARSLGIGWWATSALESDLGLAAIGQWVDGYTPVMPQGLGTGKLYTNNISSPLCLEGERLKCEPSGLFEFPELSWRN